MTLLVLRVIFTAWILFNMWLGHRWALYTAVTLITLSQEVAHLALGRVIMDHSRLAKLVRTLAEMAGHGRDA